VAARLEGTLGGDITLTLTAADGRTARASWPGPLEAARTRATSPDDIREQLDRLGDTPFELGELTLALPAGVMIPRSVLNDLRRQAVAELAAPKRHAIADPLALDHLRAGIPPDDAVSAEPRLTVLVRSLDQLDAVLAWPPPLGLPRPAAVYCDFEDPRRYKEAVPRANAAGIPIGLATLRILKPGEDGFQSPIVRAAPDHVLVRNLASIDFFREHLPTATLIGDFSLNVANELTADLLMREGLARLVPSVDLNWEQLAALVRRSLPDWYEPVVHQHMPMFHMEHCVFAAFLSSGKDHRDCGRPCDRHRVELRDRVGATFPVLPDTGCRNTVFNSVAQSGAEYIRRMRELGLSRFRVDLLREKPEEVGPLLTRYARVVACLDDGRTTWRELKSLNQLGVTRGTLQLV
jgi:putative protease